MSEFNNMNNFFMNQNESNGQGLGSELFLASSKPMTAHPSSQTDFTAHFTPEIRKELLRQPNSDLLQLNPMLILKSPSTGSIFNDLVKMRK